MDNYEAQVEAALADIKLRDMAKNQEKKLKDTKELISFLDKNPLFKEYYNLTKNVERF